MAEFSDVKNSIIEAMGNPDTLEASMKGILETIEGDYTNFKATTESLEKANGRIRDLQDTNHKLFLAQTGEPEDPEEEVELPTGLDVIKEFQDKVNALSENGKE